MNLIFDTSILIDIERRKEETLEKLRELVATYPAPAKLTFINEFEFLFGLKEYEPKKKEKALQFLNNFHIIQTTKKTAKILADIKWKYDKKGITMSLTDLIISCITIENNMVLVTKDKDFLKIEELNKIVI